MHGQYQRRSVLKSMSLDIQWVTNTPDALMCGLCSPEIATTHSSELSALFLGMRRTLECLARTHPLIFAPPLIQQFVSLTTYNASLADSLCSLCSRDDSPMKHTWESLFQTIQTQFPNVPQHQRRLLIEHSLEMAAYRDILKRVRGNHSPKSQLDIRRTCPPKEDQEQDGVDRMLTFDDFAFEEVDDIDEDPLLCETS
ncbi:hypothetical protein BGZ70_007480 [Mortierella alpina]|uniref:Uncharacterized protein n=1 Tax=Mortierella alpina TaxID=64518 RepID=A0A9P6J5S5_MORAP|nr:hypothetical protein BGZ70_007480 [Mortierella alpina]